MLHTVNASFCKQRPDISHAKEQACYTLCMPRSIKQRSDISHAKEQACYTLCMPRSISKDPSCLDPTDRVVEWKMHLIGYIHCSLNKDPTHSGTSVLHTVYASFYKQRSDISHPKERTRYTLSMPRSLSKDPTHSVAARRNKHATYCACLAL